MYQIIFEKNSKKQFYKLKRDVQKKLTEAINKKLAVNPKKYLTPLVGDMAGLYKFRVGDYRLLCSRDDKRFHILVIKVKHRREVYRSN